MTATTISDTERRDVARRLRELRSGWSSGECYYTIIHALGLPDTSREDGGTALYVRIADLIDPDTTTDTTKSSDVTTKCDRDALLALADEMMDVSIGISSADGIRPLGAAYIVQGYARKIREACGVVAR